MTRPGIALLFGLCALTSSYAQNCTNTSVGATPLTDLGPDAYQGFEGGLYPGGVNARPLAHDAAGLARASQVVPRSADGSVAAGGGGRIVVLSIGMSNTHIHTSGWIAAANADPQLAPKVQIVNGAQSGQDASVIKNPNAAYWSHVDQQLAQTGATGGQVQAIWLFNVHPAPVPPFPQHAVELADDLTAILQILHGKFPNLALVFLSSRVYGGYDAIQLGPEPVAYESGFAVKWLIERQLQGDPQLNFDPAAGPVVAPWIAWGPYPWADGLSPRSDQLIWECTDFSADGAHPADPGKAKSGAMLHHFFRTDATTRTWYLSGGSVVCPEPATVLWFGTGAPSSGAPRLAISAPPASPSEQTIHVHLHDAGVGAAFFLAGINSFADGQVPLLGGSLLVDPLFVVPTATDVEGKAWLPIGEIPGSAALCGATIHFQGVAPLASGTGALGLTRGWSMTVGH